MGSKRALDEPTKVLEVTHPKSKWALDEPTKVLEVHAAALQSSGSLESSLHIEQEHNFDGLKPHAVAEGLWAAGLPAPFAAVISAAVPRPRLAVQRVDGKGLRRSPQAA